MLQTEKTATSTYSVIRKDKSKHKHRPKTKAKQGYKVQDKSLGDQNRGCKKCLFQGLHQNTNTTLLAATERSHSVLTVYE